MSEFKQVGNRVYLELDGDEVDALGELELNGEEYQLFFLDSMGYSWAWPHKLDRLPIDMADLETNSAASISGDGSEYGDAALIQLMK